MIGMSSWVSCGHLQSSHSIVRICLSATCFVGCSCDVEWQRENILLKVSQVLRTAGEEFRRSDDLKHDQNSNISILTPSFTHLPPLNLSLASFTHLPSFTPSMYPSPPPLYKHTLPSTQKERAGKQPNIYLMTRWALAHETWHCLCSSLRLMTLVLTSDLQAWVVTFLCKKFFFTLLEGQKTISRIQDSNFTFLTARNCHKNLSCLSTMKPVETRTSLRLFRPYHEVFRRAAA